MKAKQAYALKPDSKVLHTRYGLSTVTKVIPNFGVLIVPETPAGQLLLHQDSGATMGTPLIEISFRCLKLTA